MKSKKLKALESILRWMSKIVIKKYKPKVVGISGSVGKTSTKEAVFLVLSSKYNVRKNLKNYNNEVGIPLTIIGTESGGRSIFKWGFVFLKWLLILIFPFKYPEILVLEMGVDRPGDMKYLTGFIPIEVGIITNISSSHLEFFKDVDHIGKEKGKLIESIMEEGTAILNSDDARVDVMKERTEAEVITYGFSNGAQIKAIDIAFNYSNDNPEGLSFKLYYEGKVIPVRLNHLLAKYQLYSILAAIGTGVSFKVNMVDALAVLEGYLSPPGRMNLIKGIKESFIIDDTYNASPASTVAALGILSELKSSRKIAVLGDMLELGTYETEGHRQVGRRCGHVLDFLVTVGRRAQLVAEGALEAGLPASSVHSVSDNVEAIEILSERLQEGDVLLIKGSRSMAMETIVNALLEEQE